MFFKGISKPIPFKNSCIAGADCCGLAVNINISLLPNLPWRFKARSASGPFLPSTTLVNSLKSNAAPFSSKIADFLANSAALILVGCFIIDLSIIATLSVPLLDNWDPSLYLKPPKPLCFKAFLSLFKFASPI